MEGKWRLAILISLLALYYLILITKPVPCPTPLRCFNLIPLTLSMALSFLPTPRFCMPHYIFCTTRSHHNGAYLNTMLHCLLQLTLLHPVILFLLKHSVVWEMLTYLGLCNWGRIKKFTFLLYT